MRALGVEITARISHDKRNQSGEKSRDYTTPRGLHHCVPKLLGYLQWLEANGDLEQYVCISSVLSSWASGTSGPLEASGPSGANPLHLHRIRALGDLRA